MNNIKNKAERRVARHQRIRAQVQGTALKPRVAVYKSNTAVYVQLINDDTAMTLAAADTRTAKGSTLTEKATAIGAMIAEVAKKAGIETAVFDRGGFKYQGVVAAVADGARAAGLKM